MVWYIFLSNCCRRFVISENTKAKEDTKYLTRYLNCFNFSENPELYELITSGRDYGRESASIYRRKVTLERVDQFTSGLLCPMLPSNQFCIWPALIVPGAMPLIRHVARAEWECRRRPTLGNSTTAGPVTFKLCVLREQLGTFTHDRYFYTSRKLVASARAHVHTPFPYLANGWTHCVQIWCVTINSLDKSCTEVRYKVQLHVQLHTPFPYLANGRADYVWIWCVARHQLEYVLYISQRWSASTCAHVHAPFSYIANGWADCVRIWCVARDPLDKSFTPRVKCGMHLCNGFLQHLCNCAGSCNIA